MPLSTRFDKESGLNIHSATGWISEEDIRQVTDYCLNSQDYNPDFNVLWDVREARIACSRKDARTFADLHRQIPNSLPGRKIAVLVSREVDYGSAFIMGQGFEDESFEYRVFKDYGETMAWLTGGPV